MKLPRRPPSRIIIRMRVKASRRFARSARRASMRGSRRSERDGPTASVHGCVTMTSRCDVLAAIDVLGLGGLPVCLHSSLRSFGTLDGGPDTLIDAFVSSGCTLLVPTFSYHYEQPPP